MDHLPHRNCLPAGAYSTDTALPPYHTHHHHPHHQHLQHHHNTTNTPTHQHHHHPNLQMSHQHHHHHQHHQHQQGDMRNMTPLDTGSLQPANHHEMLPTTASDTSYQPYQQPQAYHEPPYQQQPQQHQNYQHHHLLDMHNGQLDPLGSRQSYHHSTAATPAGYLATDAVFENPMSPHNLASSAALPPVSSQVRNPSMYMKSPTQTLATSHSPHQQYSHLAHHATYNGTVNNHLNTHNLQQQPHHVRQYPVAAHYGNPLPHHTIIYSPTNLGLLQGDQGTNLSNKQPATTTTSATSTPTLSVNHDRLSSDSLKHGECNPNPILDEQHQLHAPPVLSYSPSTDHLSAASSLVPIDQNIGNNNNASKQMPICLDRLSSDSLKQEAPLKLDSHHLMLEEGQLNSLTMKPPQTTYSPKQMNANQQTKQQLPINDQLSGHNQLNLTNNNKHLETKLESQISQLHQQCAVLLDEQQHGGLMQAAAMNSPNNGTNASNSTQNNNSNSTNNGNSSGRSKRLRTSFKHNQLKEMKRWFSRNQNPDAKDLKTLAQTTGLSKRVLQVWFQNARAKYRRNNAKGLVASQQLFEVNQHTPQLLQFQQHHHQPSSQTAAPPVQQQQQHHQQNYYQHHSSRSLTAELEQQHQASSLTTQVVSMGQQAASSVGPEPPLA